MELLSLSFASEWRPGCIYEVDEKRGLSQVAQGIAALVTQPAQPPKPKAPPPPPEIPDIILRARELKPWPKKGPRPARFIELYPNSPRVAFAQDHLDLEEALSQRAAVEAAEEAAQEA